MNEFTKGEFEVGMDDAYAPGCDFIPIESSSGVVLAWAMTDVDVGMTDEVRANAALIAAALTAATRLAEQGYDAMAAIEALPKIVGALRPFAIFQATGSFDGSVYEDKPDDFLVLISNRTGKSITLGNFRDALAALSAFEGE